MKKTLIAATSFVAGLWATMAVAYAQTAGPLDDVKTQANSAKTELSSFVTGTAVPILFGLLILGVGIALATKYVRRGARAA